MKAHFTMACERDVRIETWRMNKYAIEIDEGTTWIRRRMQSTSFFSSVFRFSMKIIALIVAHISLAYKKLTIHYNNYKTNAKWRNICKRRTLANGVQSLSFSHALSSGIYGYKTEVAKTHPMKNRKIKLVKHTHSLCVCEEPEWVCRNVQRAFHFSLVINLSFFFSFVHILPLNCHHLGGWYVFFFTSFSSKSQ